MGFVQRWHKSQVKNAINVLNRTQSKIVAKGALNKLIKHPDAASSAIPLLADLAARHPDPDFRQQAENGLRKIAHTYKDPGIKEMARKALNQLTSSSCSCQLKQGD